MKIKEIQHGHGIFATIYTVYIYIYVTHTHTHNFRNEFLGRNLWEKETRLESRYPFHRFVANHSRHGEILQVGCFLHQQNASGLKQCSSPFQVLITVLMIL